MHILYVLSILVFTFLMARSVILFRKVVDNNLGYEEIILAAMMIISALNISMDVATVLGYHPLSQLDLFKNIGLGSKIFQSLLCYTTQLYINNTYSLRIATKG